MSEMTTPASFIAAVVLMMFLGTIVLTLTTGSIVVFIVGIVLSMVIPRAMIGVGRD